jgi:hypothetical protein
MDYEMMLLRIRRTAVIRSIRETSVWVCSGCQAGLEMRVRLEDRHARHSRIVREVAGSGMLAVRWTDRYSMQYGKKLHGNLHFCACVRASGT